MQVLYLPFRVLIELNLLCSR